MKTFLPWNAPLLPAAAKRLLDGCVEKTPGSLDADLGDHIVVVRGRNAGRRLLALLATEAQRRGRSLIPPRLITPGSLDSVLFLNRGNAVASRLTQCLAWLRTLQCAGEEALNAIWASPSSRDRTVILARFLDQTWQQLSASGCDFAEGYRRLCQVAPEASVDEESRWAALSSLLDAYRRCLDSWGLADPSDFRLNKGKHVVANPEARVVLVGVVELSPELVSLLKELPNEPSVFIHAPESEAAGFDDWGRLVPGYWAKRPCRFDHGEIHVVADAAGQAQRCAEVIANWRAAGLHTGAITIAIPEPEALGTIIGTLSDTGIPVRSAEGLPASHSPVLQLLAAVAEFLDSGFDAPPRYSAAARIVRHPDVEKLMGYSARKFDRYFIEHLPERLEVAGDNDPLSAEISGIMARLGALTHIRSDSFADDVTEFLLKIYGERRLNRGAPEDRAVIHSLEAVRNALDGIKTLEALPAKAMGDFDSADLLRILIEIASAAGIPSEGAPDAVELAGWLEAAADDAPALIVTSVFEGSLPEGASAEPLLHDSLRERLGLPCRASRFARDQYTLWTVAESRRKCGQVALIAPRRNATGEPARPSRLLVAGHQNGELAARLIGLASATKPVPQLAAAGPGIQPPEPDPERMRGFRIFRPTCFKTYLESPRLFYFKYVLGLTDENDDAQELDAAMFGTIVHAVLREFGERWLGKNARPSPTEIEAELDSLLCAYMKRTFGRHALPPVHTQELALQQRLRMFARHQAAAFEEGWQIAHVESDESLLVPFEVDGAPADVQLKGKIDRIDWHPDLGWRVIDYKTAAEAVTPEKAHFAKSGWKDLQLPLYIKLLPALALPQGPVDPERTELVYFNLPAEWDNSGITESFPRDKIPEAWEQAEAIVREVCNGAGCLDIGKLSRHSDPAFVALCGMNGITIGGEGEEED